MIAAATVKTIPSAFGEIEVGWDGERMLAVLAIDTETCLIEGRDRVPELVLMSVSDGRRHVVVPADQVASFLRMHRDATWVMFNAAFDFWVLHEHLQRSGTPDVIDVLWERVESGNLWDPMLLAKLLSIAQTGKLPNRGGDLESLCRRYTEVELDKESDAGYRMNYHTLQGKPLQEVEDPGWFVYAAKDAYATIALYAALVDEVMPLYPDALPPLGLLTEQVQVMGAIALAAVSRRGLCVDGAGAAELMGKLDAKRSKIINDFDEELAKGATAHLEVFKRDSEGRLLWTSKGKPQQSTSQLQQMLLIELDRFKEASGSEMALPLSGKGQGISTRAQDWEPLRCSSRLIHLWLELNETSKLMQLVPDPGVDHVYPRYNPLVATGRTSCSKPNIQQVPRSGGVRELFVPAPGHVFIGADYSCLELRTLAHVCRKRFGESRLAEIFEQGIDPHEYTAQLMLSLNDQAMAKLKQEDPSTFKAERQKAKAINFGVPGGMGAASLRDYAAKTFGVEMSLEDAEHLRFRLIDDVYPEIGLYLQEDAMEVIAANLQCTANTLWHRFGMIYDRQGWLPSNLLRIARGEVLKASGEPYKEYWLDKVWGGLTDCNNNPDLVADLCRRVGSPQLERRLSGRTVVTDTGRFRSGCTYCQARNTPFQGLAADGAKLALYRLVRSGWRVVAFIHDEVIVEVPVSEDVEAKGKELREVMVNAMAEVVTEVPVEVSEPAVMDRWVK